MIPEDAIDILQVEKMDLVSCNTENDVGYLIEAMNLAIRAIGKDIPLEPEYAAYGLDPAFHRCPVCNTVISFENGTPKRCNDCGQLFEWEE